MGNYQRLRLCGTHVDTYVQAFLCGAFIAFK